MKHYICYCDGAVKNNGKKNPDAPTYGGVGVAILNEDNELLFSKGFGYAEKGKFKKKITNNIMELMAVINGINFFKKNIKKGDEKIHLTICSDSEYVVKGYNERIRKWIHNDWTINDGSEVKNKDLWIRILDLLGEKDTPEVNFVHVDGHSTDEFNNLVDKLAVEAKEKAVKKYEG